MKYRKKKFEVAHDWDRRAVTIRRTDLERAGIIGKAARTTSIESGRMNGAEAQYAGRLEHMRLSDEIVAWDFEPESLRLSHAREQTKRSRASFYMPDFRVIRNDGTIEFHEVKGQWEEAARVRIRTAADRHPYRFVVVYAERRRGQKAYHFRMETVT